MQAKDVVRGVDDVLDGGVGDTGLGRLGIGAEVGAAKVGEKQGPAARSTEGKIVVDLVEAVIAPGVETNDERDGAGGARRDKEKAGLGCAVQGRGD